MRSTNRHHPGLEACPAHGRACLGQRITTLLVILGSAMRIVATAANTLHDHKAQVGLRSARRIPLRGLHMLENPKEGV
jgi:hypothetical protein